MEGSAALLKVIQDIHELLDVCASKLANSKASGVSFYPSQDVMNQHLRRGGWPTLTVPFPQRDQSLVHNLKGHTDWIRSCAFSPDAQLIASASDDYTVRIWNTRTGKMQHVFDDFQSWIFSIAWSPADNKLLAAANGECVSILDMATGQYKRTLDFESQGRVRSLAFSADGTRLAAAVGRNTVVWDILSFHQVATMAATNDDDTVEHVEFCMTNNILLLLSESSTTVWELEDGEATRKIEIDEEASVYAGTLSPDGKYVALATESSLELRNTEDQSVGGTPLSMTVLISALAFSPDGKHLAVGFEDGDIKIFDPWTGHPVQTLKGHSRPVYKVSFSSSGDHLISCSSDKSLRLWRIESDVAGQLANHEEGHLQPITCVEISPDGRFLVSASEDQSLCLWDGRDGTFKSKCEHEDSVVLSIGFSSDGSLLVTSARDGSVRLFEISSETEALKFIRLFEGHTDWVRSVMFTPDGNWIASGSDDSTVRLWNITDQRAGPILLEAHEDYVRSVAFSPDGTLLASGGDDRRVIIWDPQTSAQADEVHPVQILRDLSSMVSAMVFTSDDSQLIASCYDSGIAIWDTETWSCRIFESSNVFRSLRTIPDQSLWLETEIGAILLQPDPLVRKEDLPQQCLFGISREGWWITYRGRERCFCLPKAYQPDVDEKSTLVRGNRVVIGCLSGQVLLLNFEK